MRRVGTGLLGLVALVALLAALGTGWAAAAGTKKLVEGTLYDTTCASACVPECPPPPHCGPITQAQGGVVCAQRARRLIVCPLAKRTIVCVQAPCPGPSGYPVYSGEGAIVKVRRRGTAKVLASVPVVEGHFKVSLGGGQWVLHPYLPEEPCWSAEARTVKVWPAEEGPIPVSLDVADSCVAHPYRAVARH